MRGESSGDMKALCGLLAVLAGVSHGVETYRYCDARQDGAQCYGALGGTVDLQLVTKVTEEYRYTLKKENITDVLKTRKHDYYSTRNRSSFTFSDGTFRMSDIIRSDAAEYNLVISSNGTTLATRRIQMFIEAPVSSPQLSPECLHGEMRVSCSAEGDSLQYSWTLDGQQLRHTELISGNNETRNITLRRGLSGELACSVKNHVSNATVRQNISPCKGLDFFNCTLTNGSHISDWVLEADEIECRKTTTAAPTTVTSTEATSKGKETASTMSSRPSTHITPSSRTTTSGPWYSYIIIIAGSLAAVVLILLVAVGVYSTQMKMKATKAPDNEDDQDVTYADVRVLQGQQRQREKRAEMEVEYGQVKVSGRPRQTAEPSEDDCVYAMVRVGQRR